MCLCKGVPELNPRITFLLDHRARTGLYYSDSHGMAGFVKDLYHSKFFSDHSLNHVQLLTDPGAPQAFISTSTPGERSNFIKASSVCWVGSRISSNRL